MKIEVTLTCKLNIFGKALVKIMIGLVWLMQKYGIKLEAK